MCGNLSPCTPGIQSSAGGLRWGENSGIVTGFTCRVMRAQPFPLSSNGFQPKTHDDQGLTCSRQRGHDAESVGHPWIHPFT